MGGERGVQFRVTRHHRVPDPADRTQELAHLDGVQPAAFPGGEHPRQDLQVQRPVRILRAGGVVPHRDSLVRLAMSGCSAAVSDQLFAPSTTTSTNRAARSS